MEVFYTNDNNLNGISNQAYSIINKDFPENQIDGIVFVREFKEPDGYDSAGPTGEIWELYIYIDRNGEIEKHHYTYEFSWNYPMQRRYEYIGLVDDTMEDELLDRMNQFDFDIESSEDEGYYDD
jgi:hypothetical protein